MKNACLLFLFVLLFAGCENENTFILPEVTGQYVAFEIDGQAQRLSSVDAEGNQEPTAFGISSVVTENALSISRLSSDRETMVTLRAVNLPVTDKETGLVFDGNGFAPATMTVSNGTMSGSLYCPHRNDTGEVTYEVLFRFDSWDEDGRMQGSFKGDPSANNIVTVTEGRFDLNVPRH